MTSENGYSKKALRAAMVMAGYEPRGSVMAEILERKTTCAPLMENGHFSREQIMKIKKALRLNDEELCRIFFNEENTAD